MVGASGRPGSRPSARLAGRGRAVEPSSGTLPALATPAPATSALRLGTWVTSPNFRHPVTYAKELMSLDDIAGDRVDQAGKGRLIAAIGAGGLGDHSGDGKAEPVRVVRGVRRHRTPFAE